MQLDLRLALTLTLIGNPKLFIDGEDRPLRPCPQPTVNNFAAPAIGLGNSLVLEACSKWVTPGWEDEFPNPNRLTFWERSSLPVRRPGSRRILWMSSLELSAIRPSRSQGQRDRQSPNMQSR